MLIFMTPPVIGRALVKLQLKIGAISHFWCTYTATFQASLLHITCLLLPFIQLASQLKLLGLSWSYRTICAEYWLRFSEPQTKRLTSRVKVW